MYTQTRTMIKLFRFKGYLCLPILHVYFDIFGRSRFKTVFAETENYFHTTWYCGGGISDKTSCIPVSHYFLNTGLKPKQIYLTWMVDPLVELLRVACCDCWYLVSQLMSKAGYDTCNSAIVTNTKFMINVWLGGAFLRPVVFIAFEYFI